MIFHEYKLAKPPHQPIPGAGSAVEKLVRFSCFGIRFGVRRTDYGEESTMQFKSLEVGTCFRFVGDGDVLMKISHDRYIRAAREVAGGRILCQDIGTVNIVVSPCKCNSFYKALTAQEREAVELVLKGEADVVTSPFFERW